MRQNGEHNYRAIVVPNTVPIATDYLKTILTRRQAEYVSPRTDLEQTLADMWAGLLHVERVDHGIMTMEDPALVKRLRDQRVPLTVCPLSNVCLRAVDTLADHPLPAMLDEGLLVTINSDDPPYFGGYIDANYASIREQCALTPGQLETLALNSFDAAFIDDSRRQAWKQEVRAASAPRNDSA